MMNSICSPGFKFSRFEKDTSFSAVLLTDGVLFVVSAANTEVPVNENVTRISEHRATLFHLSVVQKALRDKDRSR